MDSDKKIVVDSDEHQTVFKDEDTDEPNSEQTEGNNTSSGLEQNLAGLLCYIVGFVTGIVFLVIEKENRFVRFHAMQSTITFGGLFILNVLLAISFIGIWLTLILGPLTFILWLFLMWKSYQGEMYKLPFIGDFALEQIDKAK